MSGTITAARWRQVLAALGKAAAYLALFLGWQLVVSTAYTISITMELMTNGGGVLDEWQLYDAVMACSMEISLVSGLLTLGSVTVLFLLRRRSLKRELWLYPVPGSVFGWAAGLAFCLYWLVTLILSILPENWMEGYLEASESLSYTGAVAFLATAIVAPVVEEVIFRGLIYTRLQRVMPSGAAVALSAVIFGLCHGQFVWFCYAFVLGVIFALLVKETRSILPGMLMHLVFNTTNEVLMMLGDWEPGTAGWLLICVLAIGGTAFCASRLWSAVGQIPVPPEVAEPAVTVQPTQLRYDGRAPVASFKGQPGQPAQARWDDDSGPAHKFPPQMR